MSQIFCGTPFSKSMELILNKLGGRHPKGREALKNWQIYRKFLLIFVDFFKKMLIIIIRMDIISDKPMVYREIAEAISGKKIVAGAKQLRKSLSSGSASRVFLACDADPAITEPIMTACELHNVAFAWVRSMTDLGNACGIEVGAAAAAVVDSH